MSQSGVANNQRAIFINGLQRGGTNILWNIMQSHPEVCSTILEINQIIGINSTLPGLIQKLIPSEEFDKYNAMQWYLRYRFHTYKMKNLRHPDNQFKNEHERYTEKEVKNSLICFKGVNSPHLFDVAYSTMIDKLYVDTHHIIVIKDGLSILESWTRRGISAKAAGVHYTKFMERVARDKDLFQKYVIVDFDAMITKPFEHATLLFQFCGLVPESLKKLRFKVKPTLKNDGKHLSFFGNIDRKYWVDSENYKMILRSDISSVHIEKVKEEQKTIFMQYADKGMMLYEQLKSSAIISNYTS